MELWEKIVAAYPEVADDNYIVLGNKGSITLQDDGDGLGAYIAKWEYSEPIPKGLKLGKPSA
jgi:hypothetical protein